MDRAETRHRRSTDQSRGWSALVTGTALAGLAGWCVDVATLWLLDVRLGVPTSLAAAAGFLASGAVNFLLNRLVHSGAPGRAGRELARYATLFAANLVVVTITVPGLAQAASHLTTDRAVQLLLAKGLVTAVLLLVNTYAYRHWVFRREVVPDAGAEG